MTISRGLVGALLLLSGCGSTDSHIAYGPDAVVVDRSSHGADLQLVCVRPVHDPLRPCDIDPRTGLAVLDVDAAQWLVESRLDRDQGLTLTRDMQVDLIEAKPADEHLLTMDVIGALSPPDHLGRSVLQRGQWRWDGLVEGTGVCHMTLTSDDGSPCVLVQMDTATAWNLYRRLDGLVRTAPSKIATIEELESPQ